MIERRRLADYAINGQVRRPTAMFLCLHEPSNVRFQFNDRRSLSVCQPNYWRWKWKSWINRRQIFFPNKLNDQRVDEGPNDEKKQQREALKKKKRKHSHLFVWIFNQVYWWMHLNLLSLETFHSLPCSSCCCFCSAELFFLCVPFFPELSLLSREFCVDKRKSPATRKISLLLFCVCATSPPPTHTHDPFFHPALFQTAGATEVHIREIIFCRDFSFLSCHLFGGSPLSSSSSYGSISLKKKHSIIFSKWRHIWIKWIFRRHKSPRWDLMSYN